MTLDLQVWDDAADCPRNVEVTVRYTSGWAGVRYYADGSGDPGYGPEIDIVDVRPSFDVSAYEEELLMLAEVEMGERRLWASEFPSD